MFPTWLAATASADALELESRLAIIQRAGSPSAVT
jgi:hypothetical protein